CRPSHSPCYSACSRMAPAPGHLPSAMGKPFVRLIRRPGEDEHHEYRARERRTNAGDTATARFADTICGPAIIVVASGAAFRFTLVHSPCVFAGGQFELPLAASERGAYFSDRAGN